MPVLFILFRFVWRSFKEKSNSERSIQECAKKKYSKNDRAMSSGKEKTSFMASNREKTH
jgi:hypothetical protein